MVELSVEEYFEELKRDRKVDHFEELINFANYPDYMCNRLDNIKDMFSDIRVLLGDFGRLEEPEEPGYDAEDYEHDEYDSELYRYEMYVQDLHSDIVGSYRHAKKLIDEVYDMHSELEEWVSDLYGSGRDSLLKHLRMIAEEKGYDGLVGRIDVSVDTFDTHFAAHFKKIRTALSRTCKELFDELDVVEELCNSRTVEDDMAYYANYIDDGRVVDAFRKDVEAFRALGAEIREELQDVMYEADVKYGIALEEYA